MGFRVYLPFRPLNLKLNSKPKTLIEALYRPLGIRPLPSGEFHVHPALVVGLELAEEDVFNQRSDPARFLYTLYGANIGFGVYTYVH